MFFFRSTIDKDKGSVKIFFEGSGFRQRMTESLTDWNRHFREQAQLLQELRQDFGNLEADTLRDSLELNTHYISKLVNPDVRRFVQQWLINQRTDVLLANVSSFAPGSLRRASDLNVVLVRVAFAWRSLRSCQR
jgi:hypothetical protein